MGADRGAVHEVHGVGPIGDVAIGEQRPSAQFKIWRQLAPAGKIPPQLQRIKTCTISGVAGLKDHKQRHYIH